eukprot:scaffold111404_cov65-Phaeocystis_antarctica.AAC.3
MGTKGDSFEGSALESGADQDGIAQVDVPDGVAHFDTPRCMPGKRVDTISVQVVAALGQHGQIGTREVCGPVLLGRLRLARRALLGEEKALWEDG